MHMYPHFSLMHKSRSTTAILFLFINRVEAGERFLNGNEECMEHYRKQRGENMAVTEKREREENTIYVGKKGLMGYVLAVVTQFTNGANEVTVKARGKLISRAVDVVEVVKNRFMPDAKIKDIKIGTEELTSEDGRPSKVSSIEITLAK